MVCWIAALGHTWRVRVLLLGDSNDTGAWVRPERRKHVLAGERLAQDLGEPVEFVVRGIWPTEDLPRRIEEWIREAEPEVIYLGTGSYWFTYRSVPLRVKRLLGRIGGEAAGNAGFRVAKSERWAHNAVFRTVRRVLQSTIGGDTHFTVDETIDRMTECIRVAARAEGAVLVVKGPHGKSRYGARRREFANDERKRLQFHSALEELCSQLHATYDGVGEGGVRHQAPYQRGTTSGDGLHANEIRHLHESEVLYAGIRDGLVTAGRLQR